MQVRVQKLRETMQLLQPAIPGKKTTLDVLHNVLLKTTLDVLHNVLLKDGKAVAGNLETFVFVDLPEADTECLIPHKPVIDLLKFVPSDETLTIEVNKQVTLSWDGGKSSYPRTKTQEYPSVPELVVKTEASMDGNALVATLNDAAGYCSAEESRPILTGVAIMPGENIDIAAGDGFRMAYQTIPESLPIEKPVVIPSSAVRILTYLWKHTKPDGVVGDSIVELVTSKRRINVALVEAKTSKAELLQLCFSGVTALIKLIEGNPPDFKQLIPKNIPTTVKFFPGDLERAVRRLSHIAREGSGAVRLNWDSGAMTVSASNEDVGKVEGTLPVQADNPDKVAINIKYLLEYLKGKEGIVTMGLSGGTAPVLFRHRSSPLVLVMPMQVEW